MNKHENNPPPYGEKYPPNAPPSYAEAIRGVPPSSPYVAQHTSFTKGPEIVTTVVPVGPNRTHMICPHCHAEIITSVRTRPSSLAYLSGALICLLGCPLGCCLIPCFLKRCRDVRHICPNCDTYLGEYSRSNINLSL